MQQAVIVSGARTPVGRFGGAFKDFSASDLGGVAIKAALERANIAPEDVDEVFIGNALQSAESGYAARLAGLKGGIPQEVPAIAINRQCSSGLEAINIAAQLIATGEADIVVAGGTENMSQVPFAMPKVRWDGLKLGNQVIEDLLVNGLSCPVNRYHMGVTAENVAARFEISRSDQDELALLSHQRAVRAIDEGRFKEQIAPVTVPQKRGDPIVVEQDEHPRRDTSLEYLASLSPAFKEGGTITAGNASGINDAAAAVVMMSDVKAREMGIAPKLAYRARAVAGVDPAIMGTGPVPAVRKVLSKAGMTLGDIDLIELNEAFAAQALYCIRELGADLEKTNVNGSGISLGHPLGATGAIMTVKLLEEMERQDKEFGLVTMCVGGGQGCATIFQRVN
ncbi:MAG: thiolase family protein [Chloroflexi bacterium]|nr:thiolase family protein [Chloroflexota bacterium]